MGEAGTGSFLPYTRHTLSEEDARAVLAALHSRCITQGPIVRDFERELAVRVGRRHAVAVSSGTTALEVALAALGVGPGDRVIVPSLTFVATANAVRTRGGVPVFADVERDTLNLSPESVRERLCERTVGLIAVHYGGHPADMDALREVAGPDRFVLEDAAHALGAELHGRPAGSLGDAGCFSFHPAKLIATGEGGAFVTDSDFHDRRARMVREHGVVRDAEFFEGLGFPDALREDAEGPWVYEQQVCGTNGRLSELGAALGRSQLGRMEALLRRRRELAASYREALDGLDGLELPKEREGCRSAWHLYPIRLRPDRTRLRRGTLYRIMREAGIGVQVHYVPVHLQPYYRNTVGSAPGDCPVAEEAYLRLLSLPLFPDMEEGDLERVVTVLRSAFERADR